jgi:nicotinate-nucleotide adenylyltransferase
MRDRIGIFGGSFDPVHNGHISVIKSFLNSNLLDRIIVMLTPYPPHKKSDLQTSYQHRLNMLEIAVKNLEYVSISDLETRLPQPSYTLQTINYLKENEPDNLFFLCIGEDSIVNFNKWYHFEEILEKVTLVVAERPGFNKRRADPKILERTIFVEHKPVDISSTEIRGHESGKIENAVPAEVRMYIQKHSLYSHTK